MVNLFQRLMNDKKEPTDAELDMLVFGKQPKIDTRTAEYAENMGETQQPIGNKLANFLLGTPVQQNESVGTTTDDNGNVIQSANISNPLREGGVLRDIANGYRENVSQNFSLDNWGQGKKNIATKIGEGLGSTAKFLESPAGRALLMAGAVGLTGGNGLQALTFGATAGAKNQSNRMADKLYRDDLIQTQQNTLKNNPAFGTLSDTEKAQILSNLESANPKYKTLGADEQAKLLQNAQDEYLTTRQNDQLQNIADNINNRRGYITQDIYKNLVDTQQLRDNADWRRMYFDTQQNLEADREWRRQQYQMQQDEKRADRAFQYYNANLNHQDRVAALEAKGKTVNAKTQNVINKNGAAINKIDALISLLEKSKNKTDKSYKATGFWQGLQAESPSRMITQNLNNNSTPEQITLRSQLADLGSMTITDRSGTAQTVHELKRLRPFIADAYDKPETAIAKLKSMKDNLLNETEYYLNSEGLSLDDVSLNPGKGGKVF